MITDAQLRKLRRLEQQGAAKELAAVKVGMDPKTARKYRRLGMLPSEVKIMDRVWLTRPDAFAEVWPQMPGAASAQPRAGSQDHFRRLATALSWPLRGRSVADAATTLPRMACSRRPGQGGFLRSGPSSRSALRQRLHALQRAGRDHQRHSVHAPDLPLCADLLELGDRHHLFLGEPGEPERRDAKRVVGTGRRAAVPSHRSADGGGPARRRRAASVQAAVPGVVDALRLAGPGDSGGQRQRERRRGAEPSPVQADTGSSVDAARQSRLRQSRRIRGVLATDVRAGQRRSAYTSGGGVAAAAGVAGASAGGVQTGEGARGLKQQHHSRRGERLLGGQPLDRRMGRGTVVRRARRGVVRAEAGGAVAAATWSRQAPDRVSAHHRLAGAQAGRVCRLPLPRGFVPEQPLPAGLRSFADAATGACIQGISAHSAIGGVRE